MFFFERPDCLSYSFLIHGETAETTVIRRGKRLSYIFYSKMPAGCQRSALKFLYVKLDTLKFTCTPEAYKPLAAPQATRAVNTNKRYSRKKLFIIYWHHHPTLIFPAREKLSTYTVWAPEAHQPPPSPRPLCRCHGQEQSQCSSRSSRRIQPPQVNHQSSH